jgi:GDP-L-fucose synthase
MRFPSVASLAGKSAMEASSRIFVAGHRGLAGSAIVRALNAQGFKNLILRTHAELDLSRQAAVEGFFALEKPEYIFLAAAYVGGILANNTRRGDFIRENLLVQTNVIDAAYRQGARKLLFLGSSCIYPKLAPQPINEGALLSGYLEPTNEPYAIAKIAGLKMAEAYRSQYGFDAVSLMPTNLYGPGDNFDLQTSHVLPALMRKFHEAKTANARNVVVWGSGKPLREFMHVDDLAGAAVFLMQNYSSSEIVNVGTGHEVTIAGLAAMMAETVGYHGEIVHDPSKPDGTPRKLLDISRLLSLGWAPRIQLADGIRDTYQWYLENVATRTVATV